MNKPLDDLARAEADEGIYWRIPITRRCQCGKEVDSYLDETKTAEFTCACGRKFTVSV